MSSAKFASITSGLLARKGEARPWSQALDSALEVDPPPQIPTAWRPEAAVPPPPPPTRDRSCSLRMSAHDYERLGILAVKGGVKRQDLLKLALAQFLDSKAREYGCACLGACNNNCDSGN
jgi:hypothetical protein